MDDARGQRWWAASGIAALVLGAAGGALERGWPSAGDPAAVATFVASHRPAILAQSMAFVLSAAMYLWFFGNLRAFLMRWEGGQGRLSTIVLACGAVWAGMQMVAQAFQVGLAMAPAGEAPAALLWTMAATFALGNLPFAVLLLATAVVTLRHGAFPAWLGWVSIAAAASQVLLTLGAVVRAGPLAPNGWLTYALYPFMAVWLVATTVVMIRRLGDAARHVHGSPPTTGRTTP